MKTSGRFYDNAELEAYVDGELDLLRSAELAAWLTGQPQAQAAAESYRYQNAGLNALFSELLETPVPARLVGQVRQKQPRPPRWSRRGYVALAALLAFLFCVTLLGWLFRDDMGFQPTQSTSAPLEERLLANLQKPAVHHGGS